MVYLHHTMRCAYPSIAYARAGLLSAALFLYSSAVFAAPDFSRFLAPETLALLSGGKRLAHSFQGPGILTLSPSGRLREEAQRDVDAIDPSVGAEILLLRKSPSGASWDTAAGELALYNSLRSLSTLKGLTYWSTSRKRRMTLFRDSFVIESIRKQGKIEDPMVLSIPAKDNVFFIQDDTTFGRNVYRASFEHRDGMITVKIENVDPISFLIIPIVRPGNLAFRFLLAPSGDSLIFWGACYLRLEISAGGNANMEESLMQRLTAMVDWAVGRMR